MTKKSLKMTNASIQYFNLKCLEIKKMNKISSHISLKVILKIRIIQENSFR